MSPHVTVNVSVDYPELVELAKEVAWLLEHSMAFGSAIEMEFGHYGDDWAERVRELLESLTKRANDNHHRTVMEIYQKRLEN